MPSFINNKGHDVVPSLLTLAAVADGITEENMQDIPVQLRKETIALRQRLGVDTFRIPGESLVYIASDIKSSSPVTWPTKMDFFRRENKIFQSIYYNESRTNSQREFRQLSRIKKFLSSTRRVSTTIRTQSYMEWRFEYYRGHEDAAVIVVDEDKVLHQLFLDGVDMTTVNKLIVRSFYTLRLLQYFDWFPNLTSLDITVDGNRNNEWRNIVFFKDKLKQLRLKLWRLNFKKHFLFSILRQLHLLQHLSIFNHRYDLYQPAENILESLVTLPNLRSLTLMGIYNITPGDVITFLVAEVEHHGQMVERQLLMTDLTLLNIKGFNFDEIYESEALTQEMKDRIYCNQDSNHASAALALLVKRDDIVHKDDMIIESLRDRNTPHALLLKVIFERLKVEMPLHGPLTPPLDLQLLNTDKQVERYSPELLSAASAHFSRRLNQRFIGHDIMFLGKKPKNKYFRNIVEVVRILDRHLETPPDIPSYLTMLVNIMDYSWKKFDVANLFLRQAKKLPPIELANFIGDHKKQLTCVAMQFLFTYRGTLPFTEPRVPMTTTISTKMAEMFTLIDKYTTDFDLKIAIDALLKAANSAAPPSNSQGVSFAERRREEDAHRVAAPLLVPGRLHNHLHWQERHCLRDIYVLRFNR